jgi:hypothetical protein
MAAKKSTEKATGSAEQKTDENAGQQQELSNQPTEQNQAATGDVQAGDQGTNEQPGAGVNPDDDNQDDEPPEEMEVFVLVDYNPLGLKCATVATLSGVDAIRLEKQGIVDTAEKAVARGKANQPKTTGGDQVIEDED